MIIATLNEQVPLQILAGDGRSDLFASARILKDSILLDEIDLEHIEGGLYSNFFIPDVEAYYTIIYTLFLDNAKTTPAPYDLEAELVEVSSNKINILRILGLLHENAILDQQTYDIGGNLLTGRLQVYKTKAAAEAQNESAILFKYSVLADYVDGQLDSFRILRDQ